MSYQHGADHGQLTINSIPLMCPAWRVQNLQVLKSAAEVRGTDVIIPGVSGVKARRRRPTATEHSLEMLIKGQVNWAGSNYANAVQGVTSNVNYLKYYVVEPPTTTAGTRTAVLTDADGTTSTQPVHVTGFQIGKFEGKGVWRAVMDISIPAGRF